MSTLLQTQQRIDAQIAGLERELLELKRQRNELSPVSGLPAEIFCHILLLATSYPHRHDPVNFFAFPEKLRTERCIETLLHVSHSWRSTALGCPELWADIDVEVTTDPRQLDFMGKHAHPHAISLHVKTLAFVRPQAPLKWENAMKQLLSGGSRNLNKLVLDGTTHSLLEILGFAQPGTLRILQVSLSDGATVGYDAAGASVAQQPLFMRETPGLHTLHLEACPIPLETPILIRSPNLTSLSLPLPLGSLESHVVDMLRSMPQLQQLSLDFPDRLQPSQATLDLVYLPFLTQTAFRGHSTSVITTLSHLRLSAMLLLISLYCETESHTDLGQEGANLFRAIGQACCPPGAFHRQQPAVHPFSPRILTLESPTLAGQSREGSRLLITDWTPHGEQAIHPPRALLNAVFLRDDIALSLIQWHPFMLAGHHKDLPQLIGWSMEEMHTFGFQDGRDYPDSLWQLLSESPKISELAIAPSQVLQLLPHLSNDNGAFPFPSLLRIAVRGAVSQYAVASSTAGQMFEFQLEPLLSALRRRRNLVKKYCGIEKKWVLNELMLDRYMCAPSQPSIRTARAEGLIEWVIRDKRWEQQD